jgi:hypothetical protein
MIRPGRIINNYDRSHSSGSTITLCLSSGKTMKQAHGSVSHFSQWSFSPVMKQIQSESKVIPLLLSAVVSRAIDTRLLSESP